MKQWYAVAAAAALMGCAALPAEGPRSGAVPGQASKKSGPEGIYALIDLDYAAVYRIANVKPAPFSSLTPAASIAPIDRIGPGDTLAVSIFEPGGVGLFNSGRTLSTGPSNETLPRVGVEEDGTVSIPFAGRVKVSGLTPVQAGSAIAQSLKGKAVDPQVVVTVVQNLANAVTVIGEVRQSGRVPLSANADRLLDVVAATGGSTRPNGDVVVAVVRAGQEVEAVLSDVLADPTQNIRLAPRDQVRLLHRPRLYSTFGAFQRSAQIPIETDHVTLAAAISRSGGLVDQRANAAEVLVFRFERPDVARELGVKAPPTYKGVPVVYRLNLREPQSLFTANAFEVRGDDLIYVPNSDVTELRKFFEFVQSVTRVVYDVRVTSLVGK